jgi:hypothetical protein
MIRFLTFVGGEVSLLPALLAHYRALGAESLAVGVELARPDDPVRDRVERACCRARAELLRVDVRPQGFDSAVQAADRNAAVAARYAPDDWILYADCDEFQVWPAPPAEVLPSLPPGVHVAGFFVDRLAADGGFPAIDPRLSPWEQFPVTAQVTRNVLYKGAQTEKVVAFRARDVAHLLPGQHRMQGEGAPAAIPDLRVAVHHFKWYAGIEDRLRKRQAEWAALARPWRDEPTRALAYLAAHGGRWDVTDPFLEAAPARTPYDFPAAPPAGLYVPGAGKVF